MKRRTFLLLLATLVSCRRTPGFLDRYGSDPGLVDIGRIYLQQNPEPVEYGLDLEEVLAQITRDYETGDVVEIEGWLLSRTEARICSDLARHHSN